MRVNAENIIEYSFFEKPTASNRCLQEDTALNHNSLIMSLSNEVGRRLDNCSPSIPIQDKVEILDEFSQKLTNSGHSIKTVRTILVGGIKGFQRRVARSKERGEPLHRSSKQSAKSRRTKKLLAKTQWFRKDEESSQRYEASPCPGLQMGGKKKDRVAGGRWTEQRNRGESSQARLSTTSMLFV